MNKITTCNEAVTKNTVLPICPHCYAIYQDDPVKSWGKILCRECSRLFKYSKKETYTTEKISREAPRENK